PPGDYTVKLTVGADSFAQTLRVEMDPRVATSAGDLARQFEVASRICGAMRRDFQAIAQIKALRGKVKPLREKISAKGVADALASLDRKLAVLQSGPAEPE